MKVYIFPTASDLAGLRGSPAEVKQVFSTPDKNHDEEVLPMFDVLTIGKLVMGTEVFTDEIFVNLDEVLAALAGKINDDPLAQWLAARGNATQKASLDLVADLATCVRDMYMNYPTKELAAPPKELLDRAIALFAERGELDDEMRAGWTVDEDNDDDTIPGYNELKAWVEQLVADKLLPENILTRIVVITSDDDGSYMLELESDPNTIAGCWACNTTDTETAQELADALEGALLDLGFDTCLDWPEQE